MDARASERSEDVETSAAKHIRVAGGQLGAFAPNEKEMLRKKFPLPAMMLKPA
ncbi:MAG: hypothetical protein IKU98_03295 [Bacteroidaceae bacterium]|nr:hypothetical protein [Bacteroidaceae bacterium]